LIVLVEEPEGDESGDWGGPYLKKRSHLKDAWGNPYVYLSPGADEADFEILCFGADGEEGGEKFNRDLSNLDDE
ncbi:type II secretion system protein GspG, partial [Verrucomicrobiota bacterium]